MDNAKFFYLSKKEKALTVRAEGYCEEFIDLKNILNRFGKSGTLKKVVIVVQKYAHLKIYDTMDTYNHSQMETKIVVFGKAQLDFFISATNGKIGNYEFVLLGRNAKVNVNGFYFCFGKQNLCLKVSQKHLAENTCSNVTINGIATGESSFNFKGNVFVAKKGKKSVASQENKTLIFENAKVASTPSMEILNNNDVTCKHASAVGKVDEKHLFYLQSRGLSQVQAKKLLIEGFFSVLTNILENQIARRELTRRIRNKMRQILL